MLLVSRGYTKLKIEIEEEIKVKVVDFTPALQHTTMAIARSLRTLLRYEAKYNKNPNKEQVVTDYMRKLHWNVDRVLVNPF